MKMEYGDLGFLDFVGITMDEWYSIMIKYDKSTLLQITQAEVQTGSSIYNDECALV